MKITQTIIFIVINLLYHGQTQNNSIRVIAQLISPGEGSKIYIAKYKVIKVLEGILPTGTIKVDNFF